MPLTDGSSAAAPLTPASIDSSTPIFALRRSFGELQHGVLALTRSAGRLGIPVYAVRRSSREPATSSRYLRGGFELTVRASDDDLLEAVLRYDTGLGVRPVLLALDDASAIFLEDHHDQLLGKGFVIPKGHSGLHRRLADKRELWKLCQQLGLACPASTAPSTEVEAVKLGRAYGYPVVLKQAAPWIETRDADAPTVLIARSQDELVAGYRRMESPAEPNVLLQEYIPGGSETIWMFNGYFARGSECLCAFTGRKLRQRGARTGPTTLGVCVWNEAVAGAAKLLMSEVDYHGIVDMGFRYDERDGQYKLLDVNPRMGSTFRLFVGENGVDVVRAAYLDLTGQPVPLTQAREGRRWLVEPYDVVTSAQLSANGTLSAADWRRSLRDVEELAWWARDDPLPFIAMCASLGPHALSYRRRRKGYCSMPAPGQVGHGIRHSHPSTPPQPRIATGGQEVVDRYFDSAADYWRDIYRDAGLQGLTYRERMETALGWIAELDLRSGSTVLEAGCGAGLMATEMAARGLRVTGTDSSPEMVNLARRHAERSGLSGSVGVVAADVHRLPFPSGEFDLVVALGLLPWLHSPPRALAELVRVLRPGGWLILTADNRTRLNWIIEPRENPLLVPLKLARRTWKRGRGHRPTGPPASLHLPSRVDRMLEDAGLVPVRRTTVGYGPFTFLGRPVLSDAVGWGIHGWLRTLSDGRVPALRGMGWHYVVASRK